MGLLDGRVAMISGVGPGLGRALADSFAREGAAVALLARSADFLDEVAGGIVAGGGRAAAIPTDVTDEAACRAAVDRAVAELGGLDALVCSAFRPGSSQPLEAADLDRWSKTFKVNTFGALALAQAAIPALRASDAASITFVASMSMRAGRVGDGDYAGSKAALDAAARVLASELAPDVRVNTVVPGWIGGPNVDMFVQWEAQSRDIEQAEVLAEIEARIPLGEIPSAAAVADATLFLASPLARAITGQSLDVNGGEYFH